MDFVFERLKVIAKKLNKVRELESGKSLSMLDVFFLFFCLMPFVFPNPIVTTDVQPYAALLGTVVILKYLYLNRARLLKRDFYSIKGNLFQTIAFLTLIVSIVILFVGGITIGGLRAVYNYYAVAIIPCATVLVMKRLREFPERLVKCLILIWVAVSAIQLVIFRGFLTGIISGARWDSSWRGVIGLASEPSYLGIACFYFLHLIQHFKKHQLLFVGLVLFAGLVCAQSAMGIIFIVPFIAVYLIDTNKKFFGVPLWCFALGIVAVFVIFLTTVLAGTRLHNLFMKVVTGGIGGLLEDPSVKIRLRAITRALNNAFSNFLLPMGYTRRIGSGVGGFICELGFFALPVIFAVGWAMSYTFRKRISRIIYFALSIILLLNNTQMGNPLLLIVLGVNLAFPDRPEIHTGGVAGGNQLNLGSLFKKFSKYKETFKDFFFSFAAYALPNVALQFAVYPLIAAVIDAEANGLFLTLLNTVRLCVTVLLATLANLRLLEKKACNENENSEKNFNFLFLVAIAISFVITLVFSLMYNNNGIGVWAHVRLLVFLLLLCAHDYFAIAFRVIINYKLLLIDNLLVIAGYAVGALLFLWLGWWELIFICGYAFGLTFVLLKTVSWRKGVRMNGAKALMPRYSQFCSSSAMNHATTYCDRMLIYPMLGGHAVSVYNAAAIIGKVISIVSVPVRNVMLSYIVDQDGPVIKKKNLRKTALISLAGLVVGYFCFYLASLVLCKLLYPQFYTDAVRYIPIVLLAILIETIAQVLNIVLLRFAKASLQIWISAVKIAVYLLCVLLGWLLNLGLMGFCLSILFAAVGQLLVAGYHFSKVITIKR